MNKKNTHYQIIREPLFEEQFKKIGNNYDRIADIERSIDWALARNPKRFPKITPHLHLWKTNKFSHNFPQLRIAYLIDEPKGVVHLVEVEEIISD